MMIELLDFKKADREAFRGKLGALYSPKKTVFRVWQPFAENVELRLYSAENKLIRAESMRKKRGVFECAVKGCLDGVYYTFSVTRGGETVESADPYCAAVSADGERSRVTDMQKNVPKGWDAQPRISRKDPIIYELSVRDFSMDENANFASRGKFLAFCEENVTNSYGDTVGLEYIKSLGATHIQLMPVFDFDLGGGGYNWGYDPRFFNAPSAYYSQNNAVSELRALVAAAHKAGLGVVADVVYNHVFSAEDSAFGRIFPHYYFRGNGEYSNGSGCGNEFASERKMAGKFILDSLEFLAREYKFDGFRFDLMGLLDIKTMRSVERVLRGINPEILLYGEGWTGGASALSERHRAVLKNAARLPGFSFFNDSFRDAVKGSVFDAHGCGYVSGVNDAEHFEPVRRALSGEYAPGFWTDSPSQTINYVECHDNHTLFDKLQISLNGAAAERIERADRMAAALTFLSRGTVFLQAGQEFLRTKNGDENSYRAPDSVNCLKWDKVTENRAAVEYYRGLIALRKRFYGDFGSCVFEKIGGGFLMRIGGGNGDFFLLANPTAKKLRADISGSFEIYADENRASSSALYTRKRLCAAEFSILFARRLSRHTRRINDNETDR